MMRTTTVALCFAAALFAALPAAHAQPAQRKAAPAASPPAPEPEDVGIETTVRELWDEAKAAYTAKNWPLCRAKTRAAWALRKRPKLAAMMGDCEFALYDFTTAAEHLRFYLDHQAPDDHPQLRAQAQMQYDKSAARIVIVTLAVEPAEATLTIDGQPAEAGVHYLAAGNHTFAAEYPGYVTLSRPLATGPGSRSDLRLELVKDSGSAANTSSGPPLWPAAIGGGVAVAALGIGIGLVVVSGSQGNDADTLLQSMRTESGQESPCLLSTFSSRCGELGDMRNSQDLLFNSGIGLFVVAGVAAAATGGYLAYALTADDDGASSAKLHFTPGGLSLTGSF